MFLTLHADTAGGVVQRNNSSRWSLPARDFAPRWRSMVTSLSPTGVDLTRDEYLEFWVFQPASRTADSAGVRLVFDLGTVNEDALAVAPGQPHGHRRRHRLHRPAVRGPGHGSTPSAARSTSSTPRSTTSASWATGPTVAGRGRRRGDRRPAALPADPEQPGAGLSLG